jgi:hypothetical protein
VRAAQVAGGGADALAGIRGSGERARQVGHDLQVVFADGQGGGVAAHAGDEVLHGDAEDHGGGREDDDDPPGVRRVVRPAGMRGRDEDQRAGCGDEDQELSATAVQGQPEERHERERSDARRSAPARVAQQRHRDEEQQRRTHPCRPRQRPPRREHGQHADDDGQSRRERVVDPVHTDPDRDERESERGRRAERRELACEPTIEFHA